MLNHHTELLTDEFMEKSEYEQIACEVQYFSEKIKHYTNQSSSKKGMTEFLREIDEYLQGKMELLAGGLKDDSRPLYSEKDGKTEEWQSIRSFTRHTGVTRRAVQLALKKGHKCAGYKIWSDY